MFFDYFEKHSIYNFWYGVRSFSLSANVKTVAPHRTTGVWNTKGAVLVGGDDRDDGVLSYLFLSNSIFKLRFLVTLSRLSPVPWFYFPNVIIFYLPECVFLCMNFSRYYYVLYMLLSPNTGELTNNVQLKL